MFIIFCYSVAFIPIIILFFMWIFDKKISLFELLALVIFNLLFSFLFNYFACKSALADIETWSGQVLSATYQPQWVEYYQEAIYKTITVGSGKDKHTVSVFSHYESRYRTHPERYYTIDSFERIIDIDRKRFEEITKLFGGTNPVLGKRKTGEHSSRLHSGDPNDYIANAGSKIYPVTIIKEWENRIKASPSLFSYPIVNGGFEYPLNSDIFKSDRLVGNANKLIDIFEWDKINAILGLKKGVNLIAVGFENKPISEAFNQEAKWLGGKKNDLVICFGVSANKITWVRCFGWSEADIVKRNLETLVLNEGFILDKIVDIVSKDYAKKDWKKFNYLEIEISTSNYIWFSIIILITNVGWILFSKYNDLDKQRI